MTIRTIPILIVVCMQFSLVAFREGQIAFIKNDHVFIASAYGEDIRRIDNDPRLESKSFFSSALKASEVSFLGSFETRFA